MQVKQSFVQDAAAIVAEPRVQELMRELAAYGLGVCVPHMHDEQTGEFLPLPDDTVQSESHLKVSFVRRDSLNQNDVPVAWKWNNELQVVQTCPCPFSLFTQCTERSRQPMMTYFSFTAGEEKKAPPFFSSP